MTDETVNEVSDEQVNEFFDNGGEFKEDAPVIEEKAEEVKTEEAPKEEEKKVNYGALHEERMKRKELQARLEELEKRLKESPQPQPQQQPEITYDDDPIEVLRRENEQVKQVLNAQYQSELTKRQEAAYWQRVTESENAFKQDAPDFDDAVKFLADNRLEELRDIGWSEQEAAKILRDEVKWIADKAYQDEVNPAERFYNLAKRRGYAAQQPVVNDNKAAEKKLESIQKGITTNKQLPPASKSVKQDLTAEQLADMVVGINSGSDFDSAWNKLFGNA
jgi:hypothetical protein